MNRQRADPPNLVVLVLGEAGDGRRPGLLRRGEKTQCGKATVNIKCVVGKRKRTFSCECAPKPRSLAETLTD
jgi:hypothetical protein